MSVLGQTAEGVSVPVFTLTGDQLEARVTAYGATLMSVRTPDRNGKMADVVIGYDTLQGYLDDQAYLGVVVGRFGNRIAKGKFTLDGVEYTIPQNNGPNALHGGPEGFNTKVWAAKEVPGGVEFTYVSADGEMGFPGKVTATVTYTVSGKTLRIDYSATTDKATHVNMTNHAYFNLRGDDQGDTLGHLLQISAERYTPVDNTLIPFGELAEVAGTPFDFRKPRTIGSQIHEKNQQLEHGAGYDHNFVIDGEAGKLRVAAVVVEPENGRRMTVHTTEPGMQFYSGYYLPSQVGRHGIGYGRYAGFALETQHYPDTPNQPQFPSTVLRPGEKLASTTTFSFDVA